MTGEVYDVVGLRRVDYFVTLPTIVLSGVPLDVLSPKVVGTKYN